MTILFNACILQVDLIAHISANNRQNFYGVSQSGSGKSIGILIGIFNALVRMNPMDQKNKQYIIICSTYDMAYCTFKIAQEMQANFRNPFTIGFLSKNADLSQPMTDYHMIISTPSEITAKINDVEDIRITNVIMDDADAYMHCEKVVAMIEKLPFAAYAIVSTSVVTQLERILAINIRKHYNVEDNRHYVEIIPPPNVRSMDFKMDTINAISNNLAEICPLGQMVVFCRVSV